MAPTRKKSKRGGRRPGAGRHPVLKDAILLNVRMQRADVERLRSVAKQKGVDLSTHVRRVLLRSLAAREGRSG